MIIDRLKSYVDLCAEIAIKNSRIYVHSKNADTPDVVEESVVPEVLKIVIGYMNNGIRRWQLFNQTSIEALAKELFAPTSQEQTVVGDFILNTWMEFSARAFDSREDVVALIGDIYQHHYSILDTATVIPDNWTSEIDSLSEPSEIVTGNSWILLVYLLSIQPGSFPAEMLRGRMNERSK